MFAISKFLLRGRFKVLGISNLQLELESPCWKAGAVDKTEPASDRGLSAAELRKGPSSAVDGEVCSNDVGRVI